ncbi:unnamed protein product [Vitrella brassicaformis CCMP3155]|uniref:protein-tyrosine-phosphatase n=2 Tax=Vitrella brassicaformis TaxID=1169539 RepID=A0A0G4ECL3_VITBC|nr:unnamed protein product [Vitrella brassicaformis CCMP3155]|eukprot:CEL93714.1 unnamed protein product [Vitrella brassicaformis CCMP3155]
MVASKVRPHLLIGSLDDAIDALADESLAAVVSAGLGLREALTEGLAECVDLSRTLFHEVPILDDYESDLIAHLDEACEFIEGVMDGEPTADVLIHCHQGISRSAAVCIAYLMKASKMSFDDALSWVEDAHPPTCPNLNFRKQLRLYERMGCTTAGSSPHHRQYRLWKRACDRGQSLPFPDISDDPEGLLFDDQLDQEEGILSDEGGSGQDDGDVAASGGSRRPPASSRELAEWQYTCKKCRTRLFYESNLLPHHARDGWKWKSFQRKKTSSAVCTGTTISASIVLCCQTPGHECTSVFVEPMKWMGDLKDQTGKLVCSNQRCKGKLGAWSWHGLQCSCGGWHTPAFQVHLSRVDRLPMGSAHRGDVPTPVFDH